MSKYASRRELLKITATSYYLTCLSLTIGDIWVKVLESDLWYHDLGCYTIRGCVQQCEQNDLCRGFTYIVKTGECCLKSQSRWLAGLHPDHKYHHYERTDGTKGEELLVSCLISTSWYFILYMFIQTRCIHIPSWVSHFLDIRILG